MDYNSKIRWNTGMMLSPELFRQLESDLSMRQQIAIRTAVGVGHYGILPDTPFHANGLFVRRTYEMTGLQCTAVLPSGRLITADGDYQLPISITEGSSSQKDKSSQGNDGSYYITLELQDGQREYERDGVPYTAPMTGLALRRQDEMDNVDALPLKHLYIQDGSLKVDNEYIVPTLTAAADKRYAHYAELYSSALAELAEHQNMDKGDCKRALLHYAFLLVSFDMQRNTTELIELLQEIAEALTYYIVTNLGGTIEKIPDEVVTLRDSEDRKPQMLNINRFLKWLADYMKSMKLIMEHVVIEKPIIDVEALKKDLQEALYPQLYDTLYTKLLEVLRQQLTDELPQPIIEIVKTTLEDALHPVLRTEIHDDLRDPLYQDLYDALMDALKEFLANFEFKKTNSFIPRI